MGTSSNKNNFERIKSTININESIKSLYNLKEIFSFLDIKQKLNIIIYNKKLQENLDILFEDYKKISGKYKIDGRTGKGSEYILNKRILIFEGEYLNGKKNGKEKNIIKKGT